MKKQPNLAMLLADTAGSTRKKAPEVMREKIVASEAGAHKGLKPITVHFPQRVRDQLKIIAGEQGKPMQSVIGEAYNDLFAKYGKPEIAPTGTTSGRGQ